MATLINGQTTLLEALTAYPWQTKTFAIHNHIQEQTARKRFCQTGSYFGVVPQKHANGRLLWPAVIVTKRSLIPANDETFAEKDGAA